MLTYVHVINRCFKKQCDTRWRVYEQDFYCMICQCVTRRKEILFSIDRKRICWIISHFCLVHKSPSLVLEALYSISWHSEFIWRGIENPSSNPQDLSPPPLRLSPTAYSVCSQLHFMSGNSSLHSQPGGATCRGGIGPHLIWFIHKWFMRNICLWIPRWKNRKSLSRNFLNETHENWHSLSNAILV
jgi:hypothetical protein